MKPMAIAGVVVSGREQCGRTQLSISHPITKFGAVITDRFGSDFSFAFLRSGNLVVSFDFEILNGDLASATRHLETQSSFDSVRIAHPNRQLLDQLLQ